MADIHATALREAMRARAQWHEHSMHRQDGNPVEVAEASQRHRDLAVQWRRLELRLFGLSDST